MNYCLNPDVGYLKDLILKTVVSSNGKFGETAVNRIATRGTGNRPAQCIAQDGVCSCHAEFRLALMLPNKQRMTSFS